MSVNIHWFRQDLRLADNPALTQAAGQGAVLPIYILDEAAASDHAMGAASRWWLHHSLAALRASLGGKLSIYQGAPLDIFADLLSRLNVRAVFWNRCYEPWRVAGDAKLKQFLKARGCAASSSNGALLWEPWSVTKADGSPWKVFTPFYHKGCLQADAPRAPLPPPRANWRDDPQGAPGLDALGLLPAARWDRKLAPHWQIGEAGAHARWQAFADEGLAHYAEGRDLPARPYVSRLSPHLHFGEVSPNQLWHSARRIGEAAPQHRPHVEKFCAELGWREFSHSLLYHHPDLPTKNLQARFDRFPWKEDMAALRAWQTGQTGIPMVDAGMRELWQTGYMHNRVRMIVGSFLVKNLLVHWRHGERWFWDTLVDADLANNSASWQWIAGCGADAAPYFRIFNPVAQGQRFDPEGIYVRRFVPELAALPDRYVFNPWDAPPQILADAGVQLGATYPHPIADLKRSRQQALAAFQSLKAES